MAPDGTVVGVMCQSPVRERHSFLLLIPDAPGASVYICTYIYIHTHTKVCIYKPVYNNEACTNLESNFHPTAVKIEFPYWHCADTMLWIQYWQVLKALHP